MAGERCAPWHHVSSASAALPPPASIAAELATVLLVTERVRTEYVATLSYKKPENY
jgi:hypothetical protein